MLFLQYLVGLLYGLLDMDGTLTASDGKWHGFVIAETISRIDFEPSEKITAAVAQAAYNGPGHGKDYFELLYDNLFVQKFRGQAEEALAAFRKELPKVARELQEGGIFLGKIKPLSGVVSVLKALQEQKIRSVVVTMTPGYLAYAIMYRAGIHDYVEQTFGCELFLPEIGLDPPLANFFMEFRKQATGLRKSDPKLWQEVLGAYFGERDLSQCLIAEDGAQGVEGAINGDVGLLLVLKKGSLNNLSPEGPTLVVSEGHNWASLEEFSATG